MEQELRKNITAHLSRRQYMDSPSPHSRSNKVPLSTQGGQGEDEDERLDPDALENVSYLKLVGKSKKLLAELEKHGRSNPGTIGELVLLEQPKSTSEMAASDHWSLRTINNCFSALSGSGVPLKPLNSRADEKGCCDRGDVASFFSKDHANFSCCPPEVNFLIFSHLPHEQILHCRQVCKSWSTQINFFFGFQSVLNSEKVYRYKPRLRSGLPFEILHYDLSEFTTRHLKHKHFQRLPPPKSVRILKPMTSKNFLKMMDCWRQLESLTLLMEPLTSTGLFQKWTHYYPLEYFPNLVHLNLHLDRLHLPRSKSFNPKQLRFNLDQILMSPYTKLESFSFQMLNSGRHYACAFLAPILMFIGRQCSSLRRVEVVFQTGYELETSPGYSSEQHAPTFYVPLDDQIYVHGEVNLTLLPQVKLTECCLAIPAVSGCTTRSGICNYFSSLLESQAYLRILKLETQVGVELTLVEALIRNNERSLQELEVTLFLPAGEVLDLGLLSSCWALHSLRLKRVGFNDVPVLVSQLANVDKLPRSLRKLSLERFYLSVSDLCEIANVDFLGLQYLSVSSCFVQNLEQDRGICDETMARLLMYPPLKCISFSPVRRHTLNRVITKLKSCDCFRMLLYMNGWDWEVLSRELWLAKPRRLILHKGEEYSNRAWFSPYYFDKVKV